MVGFVGMEDLAHIVAGDHKRKVITTGIIRKVELVPRCLRISEVSCWTRPESCWHIMRVLEMTNGEAHGPVQVCKVFCVNDLD